MASWKAESPFFKRRSRPPLLGEKSGKCWTLRDRAEERLSSSSVSGEVIYSLSRFARRGQTSREENGSSGTARAFLPASGPELHDREGPGDPSAEPAPALVGDLDRGRREQAPQAERHLLELALMRAFRRHGLQFDQVCGQVVENRE